MIPGVVIRAETPKDPRAITEVTVAAFKTLEVSRHTEQFIIDALRADKALALSLVAETGGRVIGHIAFSPVTLSGGTPSWYGLGPVSVLPEHQRRGIGAALIHEGLARLKAMKARGCCLVGHPGYYAKFGFKNPTGLSLPGVPPEVFFALSFDGRVPQGTVAFHKGFTAEGPRESPSPAKSGNSWRKPALFLAAAALALAMVARGWLALPHRQGPARRVSDAFVQLCQDRDYKNAYALTVKTGYVGGSLEDFVLKVQKENFDPSPIFQSTHPPQTNGNRLRRWLTGQDVNMARLTIEYTGGCLLGIHLLRTEEDRWAVYKFGCHAG